MAAKQHKAPRKGGSRHSSGLQALAARSAGGLPIDARLYALLQKGDYAAAEQLACSLLQLTPRDGQLRKAYAGALLHQEKLDAALPECRQAVKDLAGDWESWANLGFCERVRGDWSAAITAYHKAIELKPGHAGVRYSLAQMYRASNHNEAALYWYFEALKAAPESRQFFIDWVRALTHLRQPEQAFAALEQAWDDERDSLDLAVEVLSAAKALGEWGRVEEAEALLMQGEAVGQRVQMPLLLYANRASATRQGQRAYAAWQVERMLAEAATIQRHSPLPQRTRTTGDRLRIGYLSADFFNHATTHLINGVLLEHDAVGLDMYLYSYGPDDRSSRRIELEQAATVFRDIRMKSPEQSAALIAADELDILVDLKGWTRDYRPEIQLLRPAPVLVSWLGYPGTLGHRVLADYIIGDPVVTPLAHADGYAERIAQMPHCYQPNDVRRPRPPAISRRQAGLPQQGLVFCSFNRTDKLSRDMFSSWCRILAAVPGSVLWLLSDYSRAQDNLRAAAQSHGVSPERLIFAPFASQEEHLARLPCADLALDSFPYTSHTTGSDALWAGVPLLALCGETFVSRVSSSLVSAAGLPEMVTHTRAEFEAVAIRLGNAPTELADLRGRLEHARASCPLFDTQGFAADLSRLYAAMWAQHTQGIWEHIPSSPLAAG